MKAHVYGTLLTALSTCVISTAFGAETPGVLEEVIVTAQKRSENLQNVPIAVTALTASELKSGNIEGQLALPKLTPNLNFQVVATFAATYIRGVGTQYANSGLEPSVPVYFDDTYIPRASAGVFNFLDLERIEVLKGPQGTLYGRNATGGAIRLITHDPKLGLYEGSAEATYGTDNRVLTGGVLNIPLGDKLALRISAQADQNEGYLHNLSPTQSHKTADRNSKMFMGKLLYEPTDQLKIKIEGDYARKKDDEGMTFQNMFSAPQQVGLVFGGCGSNRYDNYCNDDPGAGDRQYVWGTTGRVDYDLGPATLSSITSYRSEVEDDHADIDATGAPLFHTHGEPFTRQITEELQLASNHIDRWKYVAGFYFLHERASYIYNAYGAGVDGDPAIVGFAGALGVVGPNLDLRAQGPGVRTRSYAPYVQADFDVTDQFTVTAGLRYTKEKKTILGYDEGFGNVDSDGYLIPGTFVSASAITGVCTTPGQAFCRTENQEVSFNKLTPKLTLSYKPDTDVLLYINASRGFKSGGFNLPAYAYIDQVNPETLDEVDVGLKYQSGSIRFNTAAFYYDYKNLQVQVTNPVNASTFVQNGASAHNYGAEADLTWAATDRFQLNVGAGVLSAKNTSFPTGNCYVPNNIPASCAGSAEHAPTGVGNSFLPADLKGYRLVNSPKLTGYIQPQFTQPFGSYGALSFSAIANYRSKAYFDIANQLVDHTRTLLSARVQWTSENEKYHAALFGENLTNKHYLLSQTLQATGGFQVPAAPRQLYVTAGFNF